MRAKKIWKLVQQNLVKISNCCKMHKPRRLVVFDAPLTPTTNGTFATAEGTSEENLKSRQQNLVKGFKVADKLSPFQDCAKRKDSPMFFYRASH